MNNKSPEERLQFYLDLYKENPDSKAAPYVNARGILVNVLGKTDEEAAAIIERESP